MDRALSWSVATLLQPGLRSSTGTSREHSLNEVKGREAEQWPGVRG